MPVTWEPHFRRRAWRASKSTPRRHLRVGRRSRAHSRSSSPAPTLRRMFPGPPNRRPSLLSGAILPQVRARFRVRRRARYRFTSRSQHHPRPASRRRRPARLDTDRRHLRIRHRPSPCRPVRRLHRVSRLPSRARDSLRCRPACPHRPNLAQPELTPRMRLRRLGVGASPSGAGSTSTSWRIWKRWCRGRPSRRRLRVGRPPRRRAPLPRRLPRLPARRSRRPHRR